MSTISTRDLTFATILQYHLRTEVKGHLNDDGEMIFDFDMDKEESDILREKLINKELSLEPSYLLGCHKELKKYITKYGKNITKYRQQGQNSNSSNY